MEGLPKIVLDLSRRFDLVECDYCTQALAGFQIPHQYPDWIFAGFEKCFLLMQLGNRHGKCHRFDKAVEWTRKAEKAAANPRELRRHPHWFYVNLEVLRCQVQWLESAKWEKATAETKGKYLSTAAGRVDDLRLQFDHQDSEESLWLHKFKVSTLLPMQAHIMLTSTTSTRGLQLVPELTKEMSRKMRMDGEQEAMYFYLRGMQLLVLGRLEDATMELETCLAIQPETAEIRNVHIRCHQIFDRDLNKVWEQEKYAKSRRNLQNRGHQTAYHQTLFAVERHADVIEGMLQQDSASKGVVANFWQSWWYTCAILQFTGDETVKELRERNVGAQDDYLSWDYSSVRALQSVFWALHIIFCVERAWLHGMPGDGMLPPTSKEAHIDESAHQALLSAERVRPCTVLPHLQPLLQHASGNDGSGFEEDPQVWCRREDLQDLEMIMEGRQACGSGAVFLEYVGYFTTPFVSIVHSDGAVSCLHLDDLSVALDMDEQEVGDVGKDVVGNILQMAESELMERLASLYDLLIRPVFQHPRLRAQPMSPHHKLVIVSTGYFANVPFNILWNRVTKHYLFEEVTLSVTPSFRLLHQCHKRYEELQKRPLLGPGLGAAVAVGDPAYRGPTVPLLGSGKEVNDICQLFNQTGGYQVHKLLQEDATIDGFLDWTLTRTTLDSPDHGTSRYSQAFIHIAAHGRVDKDNPRGAVELARIRASQGGGQAAFQQSLHSSVLSKNTRSMLRAIAEEEAELAVRASATSILELDHSNGFLPSQWILNSSEEWSAYMVVLSACNSNDGQVVDYGTLNLGRAFMFQGIPCSLLSQWPLDDGTTPHLMLLFYKAMREGQDVSSALRSAMVSMLKDGYPLHQLAPFVVNGVPTVCLPPQMQLIC